MNFSSVNHGLAVPLLPTALTKMADLTASGSTASFQCPFDSGPLVAVPACPDLVADELDLCSADYDAALDADAAHAVAMADRAAFNAALDGNLAAAAAMVTVRRRLDDLVVIGPAATFLLASTVADLRLVAAEVLGVDFTEALWNALHQTWSEAEFAGRRELLQRCRSLPSASALGIPVVGGAPPIFNVNGLVTDLGGQLSVSVPAPTPRLFSLWVPQCRENMLNLQPLQSCAAYGGSPPPLLGFYGMF